MVLHAWQNTIGHLGTTIFFIRIIFDILKMYEIYLTIIIFRISLLTISVICILLTILLMGYVYSYRKLKVHTHTQQKYTVFEIQNFIFVVYEIVWCFLNQVIKVTSPIFLCITLVGAVIMYMEVMLSIICFFLPVSFQKI